MKTKNSKDSIRVKVIEIATKKETIYPSLNEVQRQLNVSRGNIYHVIKGNRSHSKGYTFEYVL